ILGKQLRYAMEVFADCFSVVFREEIYPRVEEMQEVLGNANDSHVAGQRLGTLRDRVRLKWPEDWKRYQPGFDALLRFHRRRLPVTAGGGADWGTPTPPMAGAFGGGICAGQAKSSTSASGAVLHPTASNNSRPARLLISPHLRFSPTRQRSSRDPLLARRAKE